MNGSNQEKARNANCVMIIAGINPEYLISTEFLTTWLERNILQSDVLKKTIDKYKTF